MEGSIRRTKYSRCGLNTRSRSSPRKDKEQPIGELIARQVVVCIFILLFIVIMRYTDTGVTKAFNSGITILTAHDIKLEFIDSYMDGIMAFEPEKDNETDNEVSSDKPDDKDEVVSVFNPSTDKTNNGALVTQDDTQSTLPDSKTSSASKEQLAKRIAGVKKAYSFIKPIDGFVTSSYGPRQHPYKKTEEMHLGIDIAATSGTTIKAVISGVVEETGDSKNYGKYMRIRNDDITVIYAQCLDLNVTKGQSIKQGAEIGLTGAIADSTGSHLHIEIHISGQPVDPEEFIKF